MVRIILKYVMVLVGGHLLLGIVLLVTEATHGLSDMDASFLITLLVYYLNRPTIWLLDSMGMDFSWTTIVLAGILQWSILAVSLGTVHYSVRCRVRKNTTRGATQPNNHH